MSRKDGLGQALIGGHQESYCGERWPAHRSGNHRPNPPPSSSTHSPASPTNARTPLSQQDKHTKTETRCTHRYDDHANTAQTACQHFSYGSGDCDPHGKHGETCKLCTRILASVEQGVCAKGHSTHLQLTGSVIAAVWSRVRAIQQHAPRGGASYWLQQTVRHRHPRRVAWYPL